MTGLGRGAAGRPAASAQRPAFAESGAITDLDRHAEAVLIHLHPERVRFVEIERIIFGIPRSKHGHRFTPGEHMTTYVALRTQMLPRSQYSPECLLPIPYRLAIHSYDDMPDNRRSDPFVGEGKVNVGRIAAVEFEDRPHRRAHLLALHMSGVTRNTQRADSDERRDDCVVSACAVRSLLLRHEADASSFEAISKSLSFSARRSGRRVVPAPDGSPRSRRGRCLSPRFRQNRLARP